MLHGAYLNGSARLHGRRMARYRNFPLLPHLSEPRTAGPGIPFPARVVAFRGTNPIYQLLRTSHG